MDLVIPQSDTPDLDCGSFPPVAVCLFLFCSLPVTIFKIPFTMGINKDL